MEEKLKILSEEFQVLIYIYEQTEIEKRNMNFSTIVAETQMDRMFVSRTLDRFYDRIMIDADWKKIENGNWAYCFFISENFMPYAKGLYNAVDYDYKNNQTEKKETEKVLKTIKKRRSKRKQTTNVVKVSNPKKSDSKQIKREDIKKLVQKVDDKQFNNTQIKREKIKENVRTTNKKEEEQTTKTKNEFN